MRIGHAASASMYWRCGYSLARCCADERSAGAVPAPDVSADRQCSGYQFVVDLTRLTARFPLVCRAASARMHYAQSEGMADERPDEFSAECRGSAEPGRA